MITAGCLLLELDVFAMFISGPKRQFTASDGPILLNDANWSDRHHIIGGFGPRRPRCQGAGNVMVYQAIR